MRAIRTLLFSLFFFLSALDEWRLNRNVLVSASRGVAAKGRGEREVRVRRCPADERYRGRADDLTRSRRIERARAARILGEDRERDRDKDGADLWRCVRVYCWLVEKLDGRERSGERDSQMRIKIRSESVARFYTFCAMHSPTREISIIPNTTIIQCAPERERTRRITVSCQRARTRDFRIVYSESEVHLIWEIDSS